MIDHKVEVELLRMTKEQLIDHIFDLYKQNDCRLKEEGKWWDAIYKLKKIEKFRDIYENCGD